MTGACGVLKTCVLVRTVRAADTIGTQLAAYWQSNVSALHGRLVARMVPPV